MRGFILLLLLSAYTVVIYQHAKDEGRMETVAGLQKQLADERTINVRCDQVVNTCLGWQARVVTELRQLQEICYGPDDHKR